jgi:small GTP-binding protein
VPRSHSFSLRGHHDSPADTIPSTLSNSLSSIGKPEKKKNHVQADYRLLVLGSVGVGKSCLVLRYLQGVFVDRYDPTVEDAHIKQVERNGTTYTVEIIDTAGAEAYSSITDLLIRKVDGVLLLYSVNSFSSFLKAIELNDKLDVAHETDPIPKVFVGTKLDLAKTHREVQVDAVNDTATRCRCPWVEVSAKENVAVEDPFVMLLDRVIAQHSQAKKSGCVVM